MPTVVPRERNGNVSEESLIYSLSRCRVVRLWHGFEQALEDLPRMHVRGNGQYISRVRYVLSTPLSFQLLFLSFHYRCQPHPHPPSQLPPTCPRLRVLGIWSRARTVAPCLAIRSISSLFCAGQKRDMMTLDSSFAASSGVGGLTLITRSDFQTCGTKASTVGDWSKSLGTRAFS